MFKIIIMLNNNTNYMKSREKYEKILELSLDIVLST